MSDPVLAGRLTEDELDVLVSVALTQASELSGGIARVGAVAAALAAALAAGERLAAQELSARYLAEPSLPQERRAAIGRVFQEDQ